MSESLPLSEEEAAWKEVKKIERGEKEWLELIDRGNSNGGPEGRHWALDPIDGTKGFLRGGQYAVCLGLIENGQVVVGVMGCPNLPVDPKRPEGDKGALFVAVRGQGAFQVGCQRIKPVAVQGTDARLHIASTLLLLTFLSGNPRVLSGNPRARRSCSPFPPPPLHSTNRHQRSFASPELSRISMNHLSSLSDASFCESVEAGHSDHGTNARIASLLGITRDSVRMDSQAKYCSIARGDGDIYLRLPVSETYEEKIW